MTYQRVYMKDKETGFETIEDIKAEDTKTALETAKEDYPHCTDFKIVDDRTVLTQHFTNDELELLSNTVLAMQNQLSQANLLFQSFSKSVADAIAPELKKLSALNTKICEYMKSEEE